jgi:acyl-CoA dehydrogenase
MTASDQDLFGESIAALFADLATPAAVRRAQQGGLDRDLWRVVAESGFDKALAREDAGGSGLSLREVRSVLEACGRYAAPIPLGEAILAHGFAGVCGVTLPEGVVTAASARVDGARVLATAVPFGESADWVLAVPRVGEAYVLPSSRAKFADYPGLAAASESDMTWDVADAHAAFRIPAGADWHAAGAALRVAQIAGALDSVLELTTRYARERSQFGRALAKFQAIQQQIAVLAEDTFAARMASALACDVSSGMPLASHAGAAKVVASEAASRASGIAHAIHGAMGITEEYDLQLFTRRLLAWRMQYGSEDYWATQVGTALLRDGRQTWDFVRLA